MADELEEELSPKEKRLKKKPRKPEKGLILMLLQRTTAEYMRT